MSSEQRVFPHIKVLNADGSVKLLTLVLADRNFCGFLCEKCRNSFFYQFEDEPDKFYCFKCDECYKGEDV